MQRSQVWGMDGGGLWGRKKSHPNRVFCDRHLSRGLCGMKFKHDVHITHNLSWSSLLRHDPSGSALKVCMRPNTAINRSSRSSTTAAVDVSGVESLGLHVTYRDMCLLFFRPGVLPLALLFEVWPIRKHRLSSATFASTRFRSYQL